MGVTPRAALARSAASAIDRTIRSRAFRRSGRLRFPIVVAAARALRRVDRHTDTRIDPSRAGRALLAAAPDALGTLAGRLPGGCVLVSATNGKTTTTNLLAEIARAAGHDPVVNHLGANMPGGVCAELIGRSRRGARADLGVFEADELWLDHMVEPLAPRVVVLGNLFRDQLDRMGEIDRVAARWRACIAALPPSVVLVVNADDPRVCQLASSHPSVLHVGLAGHDREHPPVGADVPDCLHCGASLSYEGVHVGHLGQWSCPACGDRRPARPVVEASDVTVHGLSGAAFTLSVRPAGADGADGATDTRVQLAVPGRYNVANAVAAAGAAVALGWALPAIVAGLTSSAGAFGRTERLRIGAQTLTLVLAKNPCGFDEVISMLGSEPGPLELLFVLNDRDLDGRDVSWIWDGDVERLAPLVATATCGGSRAAEAAMRLDYAGVDASVIEVVDGIAEPLERALRRARGSVVALANYSAMLDLRETIAEQGHAARYWW